jgi:ABC-type uncharacterized transport system auxiliary subunit
LNSWRIWMAAVLCWALAGCGEQGVPVPSDRFHRLVVGSPTTIYKKPPVAGILEVDRYRGAGVLQDRAVIFVEADSPDVLHQYYYHLWADSPTLILQTATVDFLREARVAEQVVTTGLRIVPTYTLLGDVKKLEHVVGSSPSIVVELEFALRDHMVGSVVWGKGYTANRTVKDDSVAAATRAIGAAVGEILNGLSADLARR